MLRVYNTLSGKKEKFIPIESGKVRMYVCGLTVQNYSHLGHIRGAINYDVIRRYLEDKGYQVTYVQNFTDINEKIIARAAEEGLSPSDLADKYAKAYLEDIERLNIKRADYYPRATENIDEIIEMVEGLIAKGFAYEVNGNVYYRVDSFDDYGKLSGRNLADMKAGSRIEVNKEKENPLDFALWKKVSTAEISWDSPWGKGWPGWHIECSAMALKYLDLSIDIHGGGTDLIFPHHENEIAQSEAYSGVKPFAKYWLHNGAVNLKGEKMSKSLGNFLTTRELLKDYTPDEIRYYLLTKHYRTPIDFSLDEIKQIKISLNRLINTSKKMEKLLKNELVSKNQVNFSKESFITKLKSRQRDFEEAMDDDFNSARAIGVLHELARDINSLINTPDFELNETSYLLVREGNNLFHHLAQILGLTLKPVEIRESNLKIVDDLMELILEIREEARQNGNWGLADQIRDKLNELGFIIKDTSNGVEWERD